MMRGNGGGDRVRRGIDEFHRVRGGDVLEHDLQRGKSLNQLGQHPLDEYLLPVEHVHVGVHDFAVHQQRQACILHRRQGGIGALDIGDARCRVGGRPGRVKLHRVHMIAGGGALDFVRGRLVSEIERHQRGERHAVGRCRQHALSIRKRLGYGGHRRIQVWHDDGAGKSARRVRNHIPKRLAVAEVHVPVVRTRYA